MDQANGMLESKIGAATTFGIHPCVFRGIDLFERSLVTAFEERSVGVSCR